MSQEGIDGMDKKTGNRTSSVPPKGNGNENKKSDNGTPKQFPRSQRKREGYSNRSQNDQGMRRPTPQKSRGMEDKRPRSRGAYRPREDVNEDYQDFDNVLNSRRKVNLNHLLNFSYNTEAERHRDSGDRGVRRNRIKGLRYNKEQFLQANCQFIVNKHGDYTIHNHSPDTLVDWDAVELIRVQSSEASSCPICLQQPIAAKMTRCGHIYCWACILHYLALGEKTWRKCPICYESIHDKDLRSVITKEVHQYKVGETITMRLMRRQKGNVYSLPKACNSSELGQFYSVLDDDMKTRYMKILLASEEDIQQNVLLPERRALELQLQDAEDSEKPFIEGALEMLKERECVNNEAGRKGESRKKKKPVEPARQHSSSDESLEISPVPSVSLQTKKPVKVYSSAFSDEEDAEETSAIVSTESKKMEEKESDPINIPKVSDGSTPDSREVCGSPENPCPSPTPGIVHDTMPAEEAAEHLEMPTLPDVSPSNKNTGTENAYYFYQAEDGQHIYMHALNARCLVREYGALQNCPDTITASIVEIENIFMTEDLRKRLRYLGHLPLTCEFQVVELAIKPPVLSKDTLKYFSDEMEKRRRMRQKKHREERRWTKKIQDDERKKLGLTPGMTIVRSQFVQGVMSVNLPSPAARSDDSNPSPLTISPSSSPASTSSLGAMTEDFVPHAEMVNEGDQTTNISFAQMLKAGKTKSQAPVWPKVRQSSGDSSVGIARPRTVSRGSEDSDPDDKVPVPTYHDSFGDAFQTALDNMTRLPPKGDVGDSPGQPSSGGKKKKKQQKLLLFSTAMARGGK